MWSDVLFKPESNWWCDMTACVVYKSLSICEAQKEHVNTSAACLAAEMNLTGFFFIGWGLTQLRSVNPQFSAMVDIMRHIPSTDLNLNVITTQWKAVQCKATECVLWRGSFNPCILPVQKMSYKLRLCLDKQQSWLAWSLGLYQRNININKFFFFFF